MPPTLRTIYELALSTAGVPLLTVVDAVAVAAKLAVVADGVCVYGTKRLVDTAQYLLAEVGAAVEAAVVPGAGAPALVEPREGAVAGKPLTR